MTGTSSGASAGTTAGSQAAAAQRATIPTPPSTNTADPSSAGRASGFTTAASWLGSAVSNDTVANMMMTPLRFTRDRIQTNRNVVLSASNALNMAGLRGGGASGAGGVSQEQMLAHLGSQIGGVKGTPGELISLLQAAGPLGASYGFGNEGATGVRGAGFFQGIRQAQALNPGASVQSIAGAIGGQAANTGAQQQSMMMTGGAYSMIGNGGRQKSLSAWADSIMKWLVDLRPGDKRGKAFSYGELMSQYYPGSNIDAWFDVNQVSQEMREYWWTYALGKVSKSVGSDANGDLFQTNGQLGPGGKPTDRKNNLAALRLESTNVMTQGEFALGSKMSGAYGNREQSNRAFNEMIQSFLAQALPAALQSGPLASIMNMPDMIEDLLMGLLERSPSGLKSVVGAGALGAMFLGDVGDIGDTMPGAYGAQGGTTTSGMHPDMKRKLGAMQRANPNIRITSGLRDTGLQQRLKKKGYANVSGGPSAHTRGMAADLGPSSEYGWISKNASKFGLKSGRNQGEPWHVGMGDVGDAKDDVLGTLKGLWSGDSSGASGMFDMMQMVLGLLTSGIQAGSSGSQGPAFDAGLYEALSQKAARQGVDVRRARPAVSAGGNYGVPSTVGGLGGGPVVINAGADKAQAAATALFNAGFKNRADLETAVAISFRESNWNPLLVNKNGEDTGLMQINRKAHKATMTSLGYGVPDLFDIQKNANVAFKLWQGGGANYASFKQLWGFSEHSSYNDGKPGWDGKNGDPLARTQGSHAADVVAASGLQVIGDMSEYQTPRMTGGGGKNVVFMNTFNLQSGSTSGPSGGIDVRRTVTMMADHLENEMKQRLARSN
jgi:hypothetical protein